MGMPPDRSAFLGRRSGISRRLIGDPTSELPEVKLAQARERLGNPQNTLTLVTPIRDVPGVSYLTSVVRDKDQPAIGGSRRSNIVVIQANLDNAVTGRPDFVKQVLGGRDIPDTAAAAGVLEAWQLADQMWKKYANLHRNTRIFMDSRPDLFPAQMLRERDRWLDAAGFFGGLKSVTVVHDMDAFKTMTQAQKERLLEQQAEHMDRLNGMTGHNIGYFTAPDMQTSDRDISIMGKKFNSPYIAGYLEEDGGSGNPSPTTALGVAYTTKALVQFLGISNEDLRVALQGGGEVGWPLAFMLQRNHPGSLLTITDVEQDKINGLHRDLGAYPTSLDGIYTAGNIFIPAAISGVVNRITLPDMIDAGVLGISPVANAIFEAGRDEDLAQMAHRAGLIIVPAAHANVGGIDNIRREFVRGADGNVADRALTDTAIAMMEPATTSLLKRAEAENVPPQTIFDEDALTEYTIVSASKGLLN